MDEITEADEKRLENAFAAQPRDFTECAEIILEVAPKFGHSLPKISVLSLVKMMVLKLKTAGETICIKGQIAEGYYWLVKGTVTVRLGIS